MILAKEAAKKIRERIKKEIPDCKFSIRMEGVDSIHISLMETPFDVFTDTPNKGYLQINHYGLLRHESYDDYFQATLTPQSWAILRKATQIASEYRVDNSDSQIDYFDCNFYLNVEVGKWDKPFKNKGEAK